MRTCAQCGYPMDYDTRGVFCDGCVAGEPWYGCYVRGCRVRRSSHVGVRRGRAPYLECSSRGDKRFSAFFARPDSLGGRSIEESYQAMKVFPGGVTGLSWREAKGRLALNWRECAEAYEGWWREYIEERPLLQKVLRAATGLSDRFGRPGGVCQAAVLWRIRTDLCMKSCLLEGRFEASSSRKISMITLADKLERSLSCT